MSSRLFSQPWLNSSTTAASGMLGSTSQYILTTGSVSSGTTASINIPCTAATSTIGQYYTYGGNYCTKEVSRFFVDDDGEGHICFTQENLKDATLDGKLLENELLVNLMRIVKDQEKELIRLTAENGRYKSLLKRTKMVTKRALRMLETLATERNEIWRDILLRRVRGVTTMLRNRLDEDVHEDVLVEVVDPFQLHESPCPVVVEEKAVHVDVGV